ncbi:Hypothetical protein SMAX5B_011548 [Scophthalmus maximus]|uniref:Uncharacterized protein n=1 Tax=Scophthalmus maximus TaxID=52904 RepID=A0A2U9BPQ6_SCOMX|nr:Hypothetical protein SMAX5B_011548 [Scophthalmus maximus]
MPQEDKCADTTGERSGGARDTLRISSSGIRIVYASLISPSALFFKLERCQIKGTEKKTEVVHFEATLEEICAGSQRENNVPTIESHLQETHGGPAQNFIFWFRLHYE